MCVPITPTFPQIPQIWTNARMAPICAKRPKLSAKTRLDHIRVPVKMASQEMAKQLALVCHSDSLTPYETFSKKTAVAYGADLLAIPLSWMGKWFQGFQVTTL